MTAVHLHLAGRVPPGGWAALEAFLAEAFAVYEAPGGITMRLLRDAEDPCAFVEVVEYETRQDHDRDQVRVDRDPVLRDLLARWRALLDGPPRVTRYAVVVPGHTSESTSASTAAPDPPGQPFLA